jgi:hypothetical protein
MFMIVVDAYSKWPEVFIMNSTTSERTIEVLRTLFSRTGIPQIIVSDNGTQFRSMEFQKFTEDNGILHKFSAPYHAATNGQAERFVQSAKQGLKAARVDSGSLQVKLDRFLLAYRNAPHKLTGESPASLFYKRPLRTRLDNLRPNLNKRVTTQLYRESTYNGSGGRYRTFNLGEKVWARNYVNGKEKWVPASIVEIAGPLNYKVQLNNEVIWTRHVDQLRTRVQNMYKDVESLNDHNFEDDEYVNANVDDNSNSEIVNDATNPPIEAQNDYVSNNDAMDDLNVSDNLMSMKM